MELTNFSYAGQSVRTITIDGEPWFVTKDVCAVLGIVNVSDAVSRLDEDGVGSTEVIDSMGRKQTASAVNESSLYELVFQSRKQDAREFRRWVTKEVLPQIRRTGSYSAPTLTGAELMAQALIEAHSTMDSYRARVEELTPMATAWEKLASATGDYAVRDAAQVLCRDGGIKIGQNRLFAHLKTAARPWLDKHSRPYQWAVDAGLVAEKISSFKIQRTNGDEHLAAPQVRITAKGLQRLHKELSPSKELVTA